MDFRAILDKAKEKGAKVFGIDSGEADARTNSGSALFGERLIWSRQQLGAFVEATGAFAPSLTIDPERLKPGAAWRSLKAAAKGAVGTLRQRFRPGGWGAAR